jgi:hypothetical protein
MADTLFNMGLVEESIQKRRETVAVAEKTRMNGFLATNLAKWHGFLAQAQANMPGFGSAASTLATARGFAARAAQDGSLDPVDGEVVSLMAAAVLLGSGEPREALQQAMASVHRLQALVPDGKLQQDGVRRGQIAALQVAARAAYALGDHAASESAARQALDLRVKTARQSLLDDVTAAEIRTDLARAVARQGRLREADELSRPVVRFHRELQARRSDDLVQRVHLSRALLVSALANPADRGAKLTEAASVMDQLPGAMKRWKPHALLRDEIAAEQKKRL